MEPDARETTLLHFEHKQEREVIALILIDPIIIDEVAGRIEDRFPFVTFDALGRMVGVAPVKNPALPDGAF